MDVPGFLALFYVVAIHRKSLHGTYRPKNSLSLAPTGVKLPLDRYPLIAPNVSARTMYRWASRARMAGGRMAASNRVAMNQN